MVSVNSQQPTAVIGDMHCNTAAITQILRRIHDLGVNVAVQVGDFGFWPGPSGRTYIGVVEEVLSSLGMHLTVIDGNHDWHEYLQQLSAAGPGLYQVTNHIRYAARGTVFSLPDAPRCLAAGGAPSPDRDRRVEGVSWWRQETMSTEEINRCLDAGPVDVVFAHDCPEQIMQRVRFPHFPEGEYHRKVMSSIWESAQPRYWFSGHYHMRIQVDIFTGQRSTRFNVLAHDKARVQDLAWTIADLGALPAPPDHRWGLPIVIR